MFIHYFVPDEMMGDTPPDAREGYRAWAEEELRKAYPTHDVAVLNRYEWDEVRTDDEEHEEDIAEFCGQLYERCSWDWGP